MVTETWLSKNIPDSAIKIGNNYEIFRLNRDTLGGGILANISSYIRVERGTHLEESSNIGAVRPLFSGRRRAAQGRRIIKNSGRRIIIYASNYYARGGASLYM